MRISHNKGARLDMSRKSELTNRSTALTLGSRAKLATMAPAEKNLQLSLVGHIGHCAAGSVAMATLLRCCQVAWRSGLRLFLHHGGWPLRGFAHVREAARAGCTACACRPLARGGASHSSSRCDADVRQPAARIAGSGTWLLCLRPRSIRCVRRAASSSLEHTKSRKLHGTFFRVRVRRWLTFGAGLVREFVLPRFTEHLAIAH